MSQLVQLRSQLPSPDTKQATLLLEFTMRKDRFSTGVRWEETDNVLLASIEGVASGTDNANWPRSAPLQEVVPQSDAEGDYLAGIGRAGKSTWSVIVRPLAGRLGFDFDFACRVKEEPVWLGSMYRVASETPLRIESEDTEISQEDDEWSLIPTDRTPASLPSTIRWRYQLLIG